MYIGVNKSQDIFHSPPVQSIKTSSLPIYPFIVYTATCSCAVNSSPLGNIHETNELSAGLSVPVPQTMTGLSFPIHSFSSSSVAPDISFAFKVVLPISSR